MFKELSRIWTLFCAPKWVMRQRDIRGRLYAATTHYDWQNNRFWENGRIVDYPTQCQTGPGCEPISFALFPVMTREADIVKLDAGLASLARQAKYP